LEARPPVKENICGLPAPIAVKHLASGIELSPPPVVSCTVAAALNEWLTKVAQPAAREVLGSPIVRLSGAAGYACRNRNGAATGPISEHAFGNAVDLSGFVLADGRTVMVETHWGPTAEKAPAPSADVAPTSRPTKKGRAAAGPLAANKKSALGGPVATSAHDGPGPATPQTANEAVFLHRVHAGACHIFGTVLGPDANAVHRNHLHLDLKPRKRKAICE
jgi:hypothetical protein